MIPVTSFAGKTVAVFGLGGSGLASCHALKAGGAEVIAADDNADNVARAAQAGFTTADLRTVSWVNFAALILTPGAPLTHPAPHWSVLKAREAGVEVIGDVELFCRERRRHAPNAPFVAITGTNGKSTTTALIAHLMKVAGYDTQMGGNIGTAILSLEPPRMGRVHVVEMSSYQIDLTPSLDPSVGILINISATARWSITPRSRSGWSPACSRAALQLSVSTTSGAVTSPTGSIVPATAWSASR
jgi:UDP-N-acetylmuramoylalanine--D-glutamate ligase